MSPRFTRPHTFFSLHPDIGKKMSSKRTSSTHSKTPPFFQKCKWNSTVLVVYAALAVVGFASTLLADIPGRQKIGLLAAQVCINIVFGYLIAYLDSNCMTKWAWLVLLAILFAPIF